MAEENEDEIATRDLSAPSTPKIDEKDLAQYMPMIRSYIRKILRRDEIEDGVQTVMARALENLEKFRGESTPRVWLLGIARNVGYELARVRQRQPLLASDDEHGPTVETTSPDPSQEELLSQKQAHAVTLMALDGLSLDEKLALLITYVDNVQGPDAAELLGVSFAAFRQRLSRARQALAREVKRVQDEGRPVSAEILAQWQSLLNPRPSSSITAEE